MTGATTSGLALSPLASGRSDKPVVIRLKGSYDRPISLEQIEATRLRAIRKHEQRGGTAPEYYAEANPEFSEGGEIVDYVVTVNENGQPRQHVEVAGGRAAESAAHADAADSERQFRSTTTTSDVSTQQTVDGDWNRVTDNQGGFKDCPYGEVKHNYVWWKLDESVDDYGEDAHAVKQIASMTPGDDDDKNVSPCESDLWHNEWMMVRADWDQAEIPNPALHDWDPYDTSANSVDVSLSAGMTDAALSWDFTTDGSISYYVSGNRIRWELHDLYFSERNVTQTIKPGSVCHFDEPACDDRNQMTNLRMEGHFEDSYTNKYYLYYYWNLYWTRYC